MIADPERIDAAIARIEQGPGIGEAIAGGNVSFGIGERLAQDWEWIAAQIEELMGSLQRTACNYAWVETKAGLTVVSYGGDMRTALAPEVTANELVLHGQSLALALDYRARLTRLLIASLRMVNAIAAAVAFPVSAVAAVRAAGQLIEELQGVLS